MIIVIESGTDTDTPLNPFLDIYGSIYWLSIYRVIILVIIIQKNRHKKECVTNYLTLPRPTHVATKFLFKMNHPCDH